MTDQELMQALHDDGIPLEEIAEKFELTVPQVRVILGLRAPDPRPDRTYQVYWAAMGERVMTCAEIGLLIGKNRVCVGAYMHRLQARGRARLVGKRVRADLWQLVRIDELLPAEPDSEAA